MCHRNNADTYVPTALVVLLMIIFYNVRWFFKPLPKTNINDKNCQSYLARAENKTNEHFDVSSRFIDWYFVLSVPMMKRHIS